MYYEISVAKNHQHYFATAKRRNVELLQDTIKLVNHFKEIFKEKDGYKITVSLISEEINRLDANNFFEAL